MTTNDTGKQPLRFSYDSGADVIDIEGIKYDGNLFRHYGFGPRDEFFRIESRDDGVLTIRLFRNIDAILDWLKSFAREPKL